MFRFLRAINFVIAAFLVTAPMAHVLEMPNKMKLGGVLWLAVQQRLYSGWGAVFGPVEIAALATTLGLVALRRRDSAALSGTVVAALAYAAMIAVFFAFNAPVNEAIAHWTPFTLPPTRPQYRLRWETGHAIAAALSIIGLLALVLAALRERTR